MYRLRLETSCDMLYAVMCYNICWLMVGWLADWMAVTMTMWMWLWFEFKSEGISKSSFSVHSYFHLLIIIPDLFNTILYLCISNQMNENILLFFNTINTIIKNNLIWFSFSAEFKYGRCYYHLLFSVPTYYPERTSFFLHPKINV